MNEDILDTPEVRVISDAEGQLGVMTSAQALDMARDRGLDLVEISETAVPPVVKIMDYGKFRYESQKKAKEQRKKQSQQSELKEVRFRPETDDHDYGFKMKHAREFLEQGHKVKAWVQFRGRDIIYKDRGKAVLDRFIADLADLSKVDQQALMEGRRMSIMLTPEKKKPVKAAPAPRESADVTPVPRADVTPVPRAADNAAAAAAPVEAPADQAAE
ncbi:MAG TPA: translation initiation factor IF-3 [Rubricoccaceae bacterium]|jgi:translation initiation factor IF-3